MAELFTSVYCPNGCDDKRPPCPRCRSTETAPFVLPNNPTARHCIPCGTVF
jgi:hypothetical protein